MQDSVLPLHNFTRRAQEEGKPKVMLSGEFPASPDRHSLGFHVHSLACSTLACKVTPSGGRQSSKPLGPYVSFVCRTRKKEKKNYAGSESIPHIN
eukprot:30109-Pelagomonas_calceolata.AAC.1